METSVNNNLTNAGAAIMDVSPENLNKSKIWMGGYKPDRYATEQAGPIMARALALGVPGDGMLIVSLDTCLISPLTARMWAEAISDAVPLPPARILISTTHTHSGPDLSFLFRGVPLSYFRKVRDGVIDAAICAWHSREPAEMSVGATTHNMGIPRRKSKGQTEMDNEVVVLQWRSGSRVISTLINIGCHGVALPRTSTILSADIPGAISAGSDTAFGGISLFMPRAQGDINPDIPGESAYEQFGNLDELRRISEIGMEAVNAAVESARPVDATPLCVTPTDVPVKIKNPSMLIFNAPAWSGRWAKRPHVIDIEFKKLRFGDIRGTAVPGEVLGCLGKVITEKTSGPSLLFSYTGGYSGYLMTSKSFMQGGYEPKVSPGPVDLSDF